MQQTSARLKKKTKQKNQKKKKTKQKTAHAAAVDLYLCQVSKDLRQGVFPSPQNKPLMHFTWTLRKVEIDQSVPSTSQKSILLIVIVSPLFKTT